LQGYCQSAQIGISPVEKEFVLKIMKILFVNCRIDIYPPVGLCYLSAYLKEHITGVETGLIEFVPGDSREQNVRRVIESAPDIVAFTTYTVGFHEVMDYCAAIRAAAPEALILLGGPHITSLPETLPPGADAGILGEGEESLRELLAALQPGRYRGHDFSGVQGVCYHTANGVASTPQRPPITDLDTLPFPDLSILNMRWYTSRKRFMMMKGNFRGFVLLTSRGCPFNCRFCQASAQWGKCRYHSAQRVVAEIEKLRRDYPYLDAINIIDDLFIGDRKRLREMVRLIREKGLHQGVVFNINGHVNMVNEETLDLLKSINVIQIAYGFESGSERVLDFLKRGSATVARNRRAAELTDSYGIGVGGQFMIGAPGETEAEMRETIDFIAAHPMSHVHVSVTTPLPGTELWEICKEQGLVNDAMDWRRLDFGNPRNPDLIYCNAATVPWEGFREILADAHRVSDRWNPPPAILGNLAYLQIYTPAEFMRRAVKKLARIPLMIWRRLAG
jgi:anaerobic magnesium-protoporphyrin IX monomethyl ester cyclase